MIWWLSFADPKLPEGSQFLGCAMVEAPDFLSAAINAHREGCNPGGECQGIPFPEKMEKVLQPADMNTVLTIEQAKALDHRLGEAL